MQENVNIVNLQNWRRAFCLLVLTSLSSCQSLAPRPVDLDPSDPAQFHQIMAAAIQDGVTSFRIPAGVYRLTQPDRDRAYLQLEGLSGVNIEAHGVTFLRTDPTLHALCFIDCRDVTLSGLTLINETLPFTQMVITAIDPDRMAYEVQVCAGYPANFDDPYFFADAPVGYLFDGETRLWKEGAHDVYVRTKERLGPTRFRLQWKHAAPIQAVPGDRMVFRGKGISDIYLGGCEGMWLRDITIRHASGFCIHEGSGEGGNRYSGIRILRGPRPAGADEDPLIASNADAFHSSRMRHGPIVENCVFERMGDDGVAIHGMYGSVIDADGPRLHVAVTWSNFFRVGDPIRLFDGKGVPVGDALVTAVRPIERMHPALTSEHRQFKDWSSPHLQFVELTLDQEWPVAFDYAISTPAANGSGYIVRNNIIRDHRARGMLLKADAGLVESNIVSGSTIAGIVLATEPDYWSEACYSRDVVVRGNIVRRTGTFSVGPWTEQAGAISVCGGAGVGGHQNILIADNRIEDNNGLNLLITSAQDVIVSGNRFIRPQHGTSTRGVDRGYDMGALIAVRKSRDVQFIDNRLADPGPHYQTSFDVREAEDVDAEPLIVE